MRIYVLTDDRENNRGFLREHGLSFYIELRSDRSILFDTGQSDIFIKNANKLHLDLNSVKDIILSHGHYDHGNGLRYLKGRRRLIAHNKAFINRYRVGRIEKNIGVEVSLEELKGKFHMVLTSKPYKLDEDIIFLGEIPRLNDFESKSTPFVLENGEKDFVIDDSGVVIKTKDGIIVVSGCAHSGICNMVEYAKIVAGEERVYAVIGGFHIKHLDGIFFKTVEYFKENRIPYIFPSHCSGDDVIKKFNSIFSLPPIYSGSIIKI